ncbi:MAG: BTAD domain-containing putative transcriptional regulator [Chloroflexota bacterium]
MPGLLEVLAHGITALLATWLGLTVLTRSPRRLSARVFAFITLLLVVWSVAITIQRLPHAPEVSRALHATEVVAAFLLPAATVHVAVALTVEGPMSRWQRIVCVTAYLVCGVASTLAAIDPALEFRVTPPQFSLPGIPGPVFGWAWIGFRLVLFGFAIYWIAAALLAAGRDQFRTRQLQAVLATVVIGAVGGTVRILPGIADSDPWIGVSLITIAIVIAAYAVFGQGLFFAPDVAAAAFRYSLVVGLGVTAYVALLVGLELVARNVLAIDLPIVTALALVITIALFEPIADRIRRVMAGSNGRDVAYQRLLRALGQNAMAAQRPESAIEPALARLTRTFRISGAELCSDSGEVMARHGRMAADDPLALSLPLRVGGESYGTLRLGAKRSALPYTAAEVELLGLAATYLASSMRLASRQDAQAKALGALSAEGAALASTGTELQAALVQEPGAADGRLQVFALGSLRVQRGAELIRQWGGQKAGTRQAEALFAFLFDRGERGMSKDEATEVIWPDVDLEGADLAFHRTLGGLRRTLEPARRQREESTAIVFHNDRYRLDPALVGWCDRDAFEELMVAAGTAGEPEEALRALEQARGLYRGEYLDDCPYYGDSAYAETAREQLRARYVDLLLALGERYEQRGDRPAATAAFRQARAAAGENCPPADAALQRLGVVLQT